MKRERLTITLRKNLIEAIDKRIDGTLIRNRSHAIESLLGDIVNPQIKKAVILAADKGIKFRPFTYETPKAMLPVKGRPILEHIISGLRESNIRDIYISVGYLSEKIMSYFGDGANFGVKITYIKQPKKNMGTGGALRNFQKYISSQELFFLIYGDVLAQINYQDLSQFYYEHQNACGVAALTTVNNPELWGVVNLKGHQIVNFIEKPVRQKAKSHLISTGIYLLTSKIFNYIPKDKKISLEKEILPQVLKKDKLNGYLLQGNWYDVSSPEIYEQALKEWQ
ncbi:MAG: sugar phosphate nucleotidyltransferase [Patescibacteria group bacterium]